MHERADVSWCTCRSLRCPLRAPPQPSLNPPSLPCDPLPAPAPSCPQNSLELVSDADAQLRDLLAYPLQETLASEAGQAQVRRGAGRQGGCGCSACRFPGG